MIGFHGANSENDEKIKKGDWSTSKASDVMGHGVYFYCGENEVASTQWAYRYPIYPDSRKRPKNTLIHVKKYNIDDTSINSYHISDEELESIMEILDEPYRNSLINKSENSSDTRWITEYKNKDKLKGLAAEFFCQGNPHIKVLKMKIPVPSSFNIPSAVTGYVECACVRDSAIIK